MIKLTKESGRLRDYWTLKIVWFYLMIWKGGWWFRLFGYGLSAKRLADHPMTFAEREGRSKCFILFGWCFHGLYPDDLNSHVIRNGQEGRF